MKNAAVMPAPGSGADAEALIKEARRRQRRRRAATAGAAAVVLAAALGVLTVIHGAGGPGHPGRPGPGRSRAPRPPAGTRPHPEEHRHDRADVAGGRSGGQIDLDNLRTGRLLRATAGRGPR